MAIVRRTGLKLVQEQPGATIQAAARRSGRVSRARIIETEVKGATAPFAELLKAAGGPLKNNQVPDPFLDYYTGKNGVIKPMYPFELLSRMITQSNILRQCIEAYVTNVESYGHILEYIGPEGEESSPAAKAEKSKLTRFLSQTAPNRHLREIREHSRWDLETIGNRAFEVARNLKGEIVLFDHIPAGTLRRTRRDRVATPIKVEVHDPENPDQFVEAEVAINFCRFIQLTHDGKRTFFKEFGDPRMIDPETGDERPDLTVENSATEILYQSLYTPGQVYGLPRWIGNIPAIIGSREAELVNVNFFKENAIPAMLVMISGGMLTQESFETINRYITASRGSKAMQRVMVLEAISDDSAGSTDSVGSAPKVDMKPMQSDRQQDGLFGDYDDANIQKVRSSFRLPPLYVGRSDDYTKASAYASMMTTENQVFSPERRSFDDTIMNGKILRTYKPQFWRYKSLGAPLTDPDALEKMLTTFDAAGALTPNAVIKIANKILDVDIKPVMEAWGDYPFPAIVAYIEQGHIIEGLNEFLSDVSAATNDATPDTTDPNAPPPANNNDPKKPTVAAPKQKPAVNKVVAQVKRAVRADLKSMVEEITATALQTFARNGGSK